MLSLFLLLDNYILVIFHDFGENREEGSLRRRVHSPIGKERREKKEEKRRRKHHENYDEAVININHKKREEDKKSNFRCLSLSIAYLLQIIQQSLRFDCLFFLFLDMKDDDFFALIFMFSQALFSFP